MNFTCLSDHRVEKQRKRKAGQILRPCQTIEKAVEHESDGNSKYDWYTWNGLQQFGTGTGRDGNRRMN